MLSILLLSACLFRRAARGTVASRTIVATSRTMGALILALTRDANSFYMYHASHLAHALLASAQCLLHSPRPRKVRPSHLAHLGARHHRYARTLCADVLHAGHPPTPSPNPIPILLHLALTPSLTLSLRTAVLDAGDPHPRRTPPLLGGRRRRAVHGAAALVVVGARLPPRPCARRRADRRLRAGPRPRETPTELKRSQPQPQFAFTFRATGARHEPRSLELSLWVCRWIECK